MALIMAKKMVVPEEMSASPTSLMLSSGFLRFPKIQLISNNPAVCHLKEKVMPLSLTK